MKTHQKMMMRGLGLLLVSGLLLIGCSLFDHQDSSPTTPASAVEAANFYTSRGLGTGEIGGYIIPGEFVLNLPAGDWRVTYTLPDGRQYTRYAVLDAERVCYFGTGDSTVTQVEIEQGEFTDDGASTPLSAAQRVFASGRFHGWGVIVIVIVNGQVNTAGSSGIVVILLPRDVVYPPTPSTTTTLAAATTTTTTLAAATTTTTTTLPDPCMVTSSADSGAGSLRQVLAGAAANSCATITFGSSVSAITLSSTLEIAEALTVTIDGGSAVTVSGNNAVGVLYINHASADVTLHGITLTAGSAAAGGGVYVNSGALTLNSGASLSSNTASNGGGVFVRYGTLALNSGASISSNTAPYGGGVFVSSVASSAALNGTIAGNTASVSGGGIYTWIDLSASSPDYGSGNPTHADDCYANTGGVCP